MKFVKIENRFCMRMISNMIYYLYEYEVYNKKINRIINERGEFHE